MKWYQKTGVIILFLIIFFPIGLFLMWRYSNWNKTIKGIVTGFFVLALIGNIVTGGNNNSSTTNTAQTKQETKTEEYVGITDIKEEKVMNGTRDEEIGKCGTAIFDKDKITEESLVKFYNEKIKDSGYNYYTLINKNDKTKGMVFSGCLPFFTYGRIDKTYSVTDGIGDGVIENDRAEYEAE